MSSAQALASGILASTSSARQSSAGSSVDRNDTGFRDALDKESRSRETQEDSGRSQDTSRARSSKGSDKTKEDSREDTAGDGDSVNPSRSENPVAGDLSVILAQLGKGIRQEISNLLIRWPVFCRVLVVPACGERLRNLGCFK